MENYIIKFKNNLKQMQIIRKQFLKKCENELKLLERMLNYDITIYNEFTLDELTDELIIAKIFYEPNFETNKLFQSKKKEQRKSTERLEKIYNKLCEFYQYAKKEYIETQSIINAYENDKIKEPINNITILFIQIANTNLTTEEISQIIGMAIFFNSQYAKKHPNHKIEEIDTIHKLAVYYNQDGTFKFNEDIQTFSNLIKSLDIISLDEIETLHRILNLNKIFYYKDIITLLQENNERIKNNQISDTDTEDAKEINNYSISSETRKALQELRKYYKNGSIIAIPENLDEFYTILKQCELDINEQKYIINLINEKISNRNTLTIIKYLNTYEQNIYQKAISLLNTLNYSNGDVYALKQYIEELHTISSMLESENDEENKEYLLNEIPNILEQLSLICSRHTIESDKSTNRFIFLLNKNGIPFIYDDIEALEQINQKATFSLINKIDKTNQSQFRKIISNEPLLYNMYEVINQRTHIAFIEIDAGIYVIIGADIPRSGYKELNNRLKANQNVIKEIEIAIKNPETRNKILKSNEEFLEVFSQQSLSTNAPNKLTLKIQN